MPFCLRIEMFGGLRIIPANQGSVAIEVPPYRAGVLLAVLALSPGKSFTREELIDRVWPDSDLEDGRRRLRQTLHELREILDTLQEPGTELLETTRAAVQLNAHLVNTDVIAFDGAVKAARSSDVRTRIGFLQTAVDLYRGEFLPGFYLESIQSEQRRLEAGLHLALSDLSKAQTEVGNLQAAVEALNRLTALDPIAETAHCELMRLYAKLGRHSDVVRQYQILKRALRDELNESPHESTQKLVEELKHQRSTLTGISSSRSVILVEPASVSDVVPIWPVQASLTQRRGDESEGDSIQIEALHVDPIYAATQTPHTQFGFQRNTRIQNAIMWAVCGLCLFIAVWAHAHAGSRSPVDHNAVAPEAPAAAPRSGSEAWSQRYTPASDERDSEPTAIAVDSARDVYVAGFVQIRDRDVDYLVLKYDRDGGSLLWKATYDGPSHDVDRARAIAVDGDGNVLVTGDSDNGKGNGATRLAGLDYATVKLNGKTGEKIWEARYNSDMDGEDRPIAIAADADGNSYVTGSSWDHRLGASRAAWAIATVKYDKNGKRVWAHRWGPDSSMDYRATDMKLDVIRGHLYIAAAAMCSAPRGRREQVLLAYDLYGKMLWHKAVEGLFAGSDAVAPARIAIDSDGSVVLAGSQIEPTRPMSGSTVVRVKYSQVGREQWVYWDHNFAPAIWCSVTALAIGPKSVTCVGRRRFKLGMFGSTVEDLSFCDPDGKVEYVTDEPFALGYHDDLIGLAWDASGNVIACSRAEHHHATGANVEDPDYVTVKYGSNYQEVWRSTFPMGEPRAMALSPEGSPVVTGRAGGSGTVDIVTIKYVP